MKQNGGVCRSRGLGRGHEARIERGLPWQIECGLVGCRFRGKAAAGHAC